MGTYWDTFVDKFPRQDGESDRAYLERFYSWLDAFSVPTKHTEHITDLMRQLAEVRTIIAQLQGALLAADGSTEQAERQRDALKATLEKARKAFQAWQIRLAFVGHPNEPKDWSIPVQLTEHVLAALTAGKEAGG